MSEFFPPENYPGIFSTQEWIAAWQEAWGAAGNAIDVNLDLTPFSYRQQFYLYQKKLPLWLRIKTLFPAGISTAVTPSLRSEYFVGDVDAATYLRSALGFSWDQLYIPDVLTSSEYFQSLTSAAKVLGLAVRVQDTAATYAVDLRNYSFESYLASLGGGTRLKLFNKRKKLYQIGEIVIQNLWPRLDDFISILNGFHLQRWGKLCYEGRNLQQIKLFLNAIAESGAQPNLSVIYCDNKAVSAVLDLNYKQRIYNIQSGYLEEFDGGISLGTLHFGFQLEEAFSSGATHYDFMAGNGKNVNYKAALATHSDKFVSLLFLRNPLLALAYKVNDNIKSLKKY